jgi:hypothetical protein
MDTPITTESSVVFTVDPEHAALRVSIVFVFIGVWIVLFAVLNGLIASEGVNFLAIVISFGITALLTQQIERVLKKRWPSGRAVEIDQQHVRIVKHQQVQHEVDATQQVNVLMWRFPVTRRARVPKGWYMIACALEQNDHYVPVYTFMSPDDFDRLDATRHFALLQGKKELEKEGRDNMRLIGEQRRLHVAENIRWMEGAEMDAEDFKKFMMRLQEQYPQWMPSVI